MWNDKANPTSSGRFLPQDSSIPPPDALPEAAVTSDWMPLRRGGCGEFPAYQQEVSMSGTVKQSGAWLLALIVAIAMLAGTRALVASPAKLDCNGGTCADLEECEDNCDAIFGEGQWVMATCSTGGCCRCFL